MVALITARVLFHRKSPPLGALGALVAALTFGAKAETPGLSSRQPIGAYLNSAFPSSSPGSGGGVILEDAFPGVTFADPIKMVPQPGTSLFWVISRQGQLWRLDKNSPATTKTLMLDLGPNTLISGDSGLLGIALHPQFGQAGSANRGYLYLWYNHHPDTPSGNLSYDRLSRFTLADGASSIARSSELVMINQFDEHEWHNGGDLFFGPDSFLYLTVGDEGDLGEIHNNAQKINDGLFSGVLRIDVNRDATRSHPIRRQPQAGATITPVPAGWPATFTQGYFIPNDNPWVDPGGAWLEEFFAIGLRSPHRMSFDPPSGKALIGDVGQEAVEEVDLLAKGANYQWSYLEGTVAGPKPKPGAVLGVETPPIYSYPHAGGDKCVIGGFVYRGSGLPGSLLGRYIFGDFVSGKIWSLDWQTPGAQPALLTQIAASTLTGFSVDANNEIYVATLGTTGRILKLALSGSTAQPPATLSATGAFASLANLTPAPGIVPYEVNSPLWSDGALKQRWIALPNDGAPYSGGEVVTFSATGSWAFPAGTVLIKHFELGTDDTDPLVRRRLETRFLVRGADGWYGVTYKWRADGSDADLLTNGENLAVSITASGGGARTQNWSFPSRGDCMNCHTENAGSILGVTARQLNGNFTYPSTAITANQLATWNEIGMFDGTVSAAQIAASGKTAPIGDTTASLELRVRSYLDANCAHCHRPGGVRANMDARFDTPLALTNIVSGPLFNDLGTAGAKIVTPKDLSRSMMHIRANSLTDVKMPPLAKNVVDTAAVSVLAQWINSLGPDSGPQPNLAGVDVGDVGAAGTTAGGGTTASYTLGGSGSGIFGTADAFRYASVTLSGDGEIRARVTSQTNTNEWAKAGVMVRESLSPGSRHAVCFLTPGHGFGYEFRATTDQPSVFTYGPASSPGPDNWVKMVRVGDTLSGYSSPDGQNWSLITSGTVPGLPATVRIGLIVTASNVGSISTAAFDNVLITGARAGTDAAPVLAQPANQSAVRGVPATLQLVASDPDGNALNYSANGLPAGLALDANTGVISGTVSPNAAPTNNVTISVSDGLLSDSKNFSWATTDTPPALPTLNGVDVGNVGQPGNSSVNAASGTITLSGSGGEILFNADGFRFSYRLLQGDGEVRARILSQTNTNPWAKAGVMIRENLTPGSRHAMMLVTPLNGFGFDSRSVADGPAGYVLGPPLNPVPQNWVRLVRAGGTLTGYSSADGQTWTPTATVTLSGLTDVVAIGLAVTSAENLQLGTAVFDNVVITGATPATNQTPIVIQPPDQTSTRGSFASLQVQASDADGQPLGYAATGLPDGLSISATTGLISGTVSATAAASSSVTVTVSDGVLSASRNFAWNTVATPPPPTLTALDLGNVGLTGTTTGAFTVKGAGADIFFNADAFRFNYRQLSGDGEIKARVISQTNTNPWAKAGVMIRESLTAGSRHAMMLVTPANGSGMVWRPASGGASLYAAGPALNPAPNNWVRLVRSGSLLTGYSSANGANWTTVFAVTMTGLPANAYIGLAVTSTDSSVLSTAVFDNVQLTGGASQVNQAPDLTQPADQSTVRGATVSLQVQATDPDGNALTYSAGGLPAGLSINGTSGLISGTVSASAAATNSVTVGASDGSLSSSRTFTWTTTEAGTPPPLKGTDIGAVGLAGSTSYNSASGLYSVTSSGAGIAGPADAFQFASTALTGDGEIKARVSSLTNTNPWSKAGVMIREDLTAGSRFGLVFVSSGNGFGGNYRLTAGAFREYAPGPALNASPNNWVRLVRAGNLLTGSTSANGTTWTHMFSTTLASLSSTVSFGLAVTATDNGRLATATFDNVQITGGVSQANQAPVLTLPADQSTVRGATVSLQVQAMDPDGNALTYSAGGLPAGLSINGTSGLISGTVSASAAATNSVTVGASDGALSSSKTFTWTTTEAGTAPPLKGTDVGAVGLAGGTVVDASTGAFTIKGAGSGIAGTADGFQFANTTLTGDGEIKARVASLTNTNPWSKAGVMIREDLTAGSRFGLVFVSSGNGFGGNYRLTAGALRTYVAGPALQAAPNNWLRLVRAGSLITGYTSPDGAAWTRMFSTTLAGLAGTARLGLAVTATDNGQLATATFDNVQIVPAPGAASVVTLANATAAPTGTTSRKSLTTKPAPSLMGWSLWLRTNGIGTAYADGDYNADLMEYALGEDPRRGTGTGGLHFVKDESGRFGAEFKRGAGVTDLTYGIEASGDLSTWTALNVSPIAVDGTDGTRTVTYPALDALLGDGDATVFLRLRVTHPASGLSATGEPLSLQRISFAAGSQTFGYANVRAPVFAGRYTELPVTASPDCYLEVRDGAHAGHRFDLGADGRPDATSMRNTAAAVPDLGAPLVVVRPHVSLDDVLDRTKLLGDRSPDLSDMVSFHNGDGYVSYWLYNATPADPSKAIWVSIDDPGLANAGGRIVAPGEGLFVKSSRDTSMILGGGVRTNRFVQVLRPGPNLLAQPFPLTGSAATSGFTEDNGLLAAGEKTGADQLLIWGGDSPAGAPAFSALWYARIGNAARWISADDTSLADQSGAGVFQPHRALFLNRAASTTTAVVIPIRWNVVP